MDPIIEHLEKEIADQEDNLKKKKLVLAQMKHQFKQNVPFSQTTVGGFWFKTVEVMTGTFAYWHERAKDHLENPYQIQGQKMLEKANKVLKSAKQINDNQDERAKMFAIKCADQVVKLENFCEEHEEFFSEMQNLSFELDKEVQRLRPNSSVKPVEQMQQVLQLVEHQTGEDNA